MPNTSLTRARIKQRIQRRLGSGVVAVELLDEHYEEAIETTLDYYNQVRSQVMHTMLATTSTQTMYDLSMSATFAGIIGVVRVDFVDPASGSEYVDPFNPFTQAVNSTWMGMGAVLTFGDIALQQQYYEEASKIIDADSDYTFWWSGDNKPLLFLKKSSPNKQVSVEWRRGYPYTDVGLLRIPQDDVEWFLDYSTALCKQMLGRMLRKFQGVTNPDGGQDPMDGTELMQEGLDAVTQLREVLESRRPPLPPITG